MNWTREYGEGKPFEVLWPRKGWSEQMQLRPFPHVVIDGLWGTWLLQQCYDEFTQVTQWGHRSVQAATEEGSVLVEEKLSLDFNECAHLPSVTQLKERLSDVGFISDLEQLTGIKGLHFDPLGGGMHQILPGGLLAQHVDFNVANGLWRRVNVLIYLNACNGGVLELSNTDGSCVVKVKPQMNRTVVFNCSENSWHGHPDPLGDGLYRRSIAAYYFTREPPPDAAPQHATLFRKRPGELKNG